MGLLDLFKGREEDMIKALLVKYNIVHNRYYTLSVLYNIFTELGLINMRRDNFTRDWLYRYMERDLLRLPKKTMFMWRIRGRDIEGIMRSFIPGGKGYYYFDE